MNVVGVYRSCSDTYPFKSPCEACYVLAFEETETNPLFGSETKVTILFDEQWAQARLANREGKNLIVSCHGPGVSGLQQLGSIMGLNHGDQVFLRKESAENTYSLHRL